MVDSGSMNMMGRCVGSDNIVENFKFFDFPLENVEGGAYEEEEDVEECDDWNTKLQSALGPIPVEFLSEYLNGNITNGGSELKISHCGPVTDEGGSELTKPSHLIEDISATNKAEAVQPLSPISVLDDNYSHMFATHIPRRARTKRSRPLNNNTWTFIVPERDVTRKKRKISEKKTITSNTSGASKRCSHCQVTQTPQWREGPMGPKTLCNACGVRYRSGRLFPEYRPMASPGFVPSLHSNSHKKVLEMRNKGSNMNIHNIRENVAPAPPRRRVKKAAPVYERDNSPPPEFIPMSDYLLDCVLGSEVFNY